jgi:F-type H+-transporting ATPase subunit a
VKKRRNSPLLHLKNQDNRFFFGIPQRKGGKATLGSDLFLAKKLIGIDWSTASTALGSHDLDVEVKVYKVFNIFGIDVWLTQTVVTTWIFMLVILIAAIILRSKMKNYTDKPTGSQNVVELCIESMTSFVATAMGEKHTNFANWFFGVFVFVLMSNLAGLLGFRSPTGDFCTTFAIAFATFLMIHYMGIKTGKGSYFKAYFEPIWVMFPMNVISELAKPISLSFRLFGNIFGGSIIMGLIYSLAPVYFRFGIPGVLHIYFDVFAGCIQTVIICMLSMIFISDKIAE